MGAGLGTRGGTPYYTRDMPHRPSPTLRSRSAGFLLLLQLALVAAWTSDAVAALNRAPTPHVEAAGTADGRVAYHHGGCAIYQASATGALVPVSAAPDLADLAVTVRAAPDPLRGRHRAAPIVGRPRAPPEVMR
jgi:hypothetical protein